MRAAALALVVACGQPHAAAPDPATPPPADATSVDARDPNAIDVFRAPLNAGPDPFATYYDGNYYLATTQGDALRMWKAPSLAELAVVAPTTIWQDTDPSRDRDVWAPSFYLFDGHWYVYYTADDGIDDHHRIYAIASAGADPLGPYTFAGKLEAPNAVGEWAIDPEVLVRADARYLVWSGAGSEGHNLIYIAPMADPVTISGPRTYLPLAGGCPEVREAPALLHHDATTYLVYSTCDTGKPDYQLWMTSLADTRDPLDAASWQPYASPVFARDDANGVWGPGSCGFFHSPDGSEDWIVFHAKNTSDYTYDGRTTRAQRIAWDGGPELAEPYAASATQHLPSGDPGHGSLVLDDADAAYTGAWTADAACGVQCFLGGDHAASAADATATFAFTGTQIAIYAVREPGGGIAAFSLDGGAETTIDTYAAVRQGEQPIYASPHVALGAHELRVRVTGSANANATGTAVHVDRAEIFEH